MFISLNNLLLAITVGFVVSIVWFILSTVIYLNPWVDRLYRRARRERVVHRWKTNQEMIWVLYVNILIQSILLAFVYLLVKGALGDSILSSVLFFWLMIFGLKLIPRFLDIWIETNYPRGLLLIELLAGAVSGLVAALIMSLMM